MQKREGEKVRTRSHQRGKDAYLGIGRYFHSSRSFRKNPRGENLVHKFSYLKHWHLNWYGSIVVQ